MSVGRVQLKLSNPRDVADHAGSLGAIVEPLELADDLPAVPRVDRKEIGAHVGGRSCLCFGVCEESSLHQRMTDAK